MKSQYTITVSNKGTVSHHHHLSAARREYEEHVELSKENYGSWAGESVTLWDADEPIQEFIGLLEQETNSEEYDLRTNELYK